MKHGPIYTRLAAIQKQAAELRGAGVDHPLGETDRQRMLEGLEREKQRLEAARTDLLKAHLPGADPQKFSIGRMAKLLAGTIGEDDAGYELEVKRAMEAKGLPSYVEKDVSGATGAEGAFLIPVELVGEFDIVNGSPDVLEPAGARVIPVTGYSDVAYNFLEPRQVTVGSEPAATENILVGFHDTEQATGIAESVPAAIGQRVYKPRPMAAVLPMTWKIANQPSPSLEDLIASTAARSWGYEQSRVGFYGDDSLAAPAAEPDGIINDATVPTRDWTSAVWTGATTTVQDLFIRQYETLATRRGLSSEETVAVICSMGMLGSLLRSKSITGGRQITRQSRGNARFLMDDWLPFYASEALRPATGTDEPLVIGAWDDYRIVRWGGILMSVGHGSSDDFRRHRSLLRIVRFQDQGFPATGYSCVRSENVTLPA